ncbi:glycerol acyltransferase [Oscillatoriales cyanobacterium USR001]|nr:glycerol acyltransferase [Oscillatoriales cyanobacterium USR001]
MPNSTSHVQKSLEFIPPDFKPWVLRGCQYLLPWWLKFRTPISQIEAENVETLAHLLAQFQDQKVRFLIAFRHPNTEDPFCLAQLFWKILPQVARKEGITLKYPIHSHFIYDRGIPLWAGDSVGWLYSKLGGTSIIRGKIDRNGLRSARELFANSCFPIAAAPEGATNGHNEIVSPLEPGIAQMGFWCVEDMQKAGRDEQVFIIPLGIQYSYVEAPWEPLEKLLTQLEIDCGLLPLETGKIGELDIPNYLYYRMIRLGFNLLVMMEEFYKRFYHKNFPENKIDFPSLPIPEVISQSNNEAFRERLHNLLNVALEVAEEYFKLKPNGNLIDRCRRLEQAGWDYIYREDIKDVASLSAVEKGLADRIAEEASLRMWHMRLVESFVAVTGKYVQEKPKAERFAETSLLLWDVVTRIKGGSPFGRPTLGKQRVKLTVGQPISVSDRWERYHSSRRLAVSELTQDLQGALEGMIQS